jgi:hypothetical protein
MNLLELQKSKEKKLKLSVGQRLKMPPSHNWNSHEHHYHPDKFILQFYDVYMENSIPLHWTGVAVPAGCVSNCCTTRGHMGTQTSIHSDVGVYNSP